MLPILLLLVPPLHYREVKCCPIFRRWCRRYAAYFTAVGAALYTTVRVIAAQIFAVDVGVMLPILLLLEPPFYNTVTLNAVQILTVGVGVMLPILLLLVPPLHYGEGQCCPNFRRWCRR